VNPALLLRCAKPLALAAALAVSAGVAYADTITYDLICVTTSAGSLTGNVTIDTVSDRVTAAHIVFNDPLVGSPVFTNIGSPAAYNGLGQDFISGPSDSPLNFGGQIALYYDTTNIGTGNLGICLAVGACGTQSNQASDVQAYVSNGLGGPFNITAGSLDPETRQPAATTEPASLLLLGTGILSLAVFTRTKVFRGEPVESGL
jgi:hypothetical protein